MVLDKLGSSLKEALQKITRIGLVDKNFSQQPALLPFTLKKIVGASMGDKLDLRL